MIQYKLLTPGPLTTSDTVRKEMMVDRCTWDEDYKLITNKIRNQLLKIAGVDSERYTAVLMQGSGTFGVEATLNSVIGKKEKCLFVVNGSYGERMVTIAEYMGMEHKVYRTTYNTAPDVDIIRDMLKDDETITHIAVVHCETTTGILNPVKPIAQLARECNKTLILDAMSSFGGIPMNLKELGIDFLVSSANKCIQGVPGFSFVIAKKDKLINCKGKSSSLALDIYDQWKVMEKDGKWRYTSPTHAVAAFSKALDELEVEGGVEQRYKRYLENNKILRLGLSKLGFKPYIDEGYQSPIITTFLFPDKKFNFNNFYLFVKEKGFILYPGKLTDEDTFRIGNIGEIYPNDMEILIKIIQSYMK